MHLKCLFKHFSFYPRSRFYLLAALWGGGLLVGILLSPSRFFESATALLSALSVSPAPISLFLTIILPIAITAIAVSTPLFVLSYFSVFLIAICHGFCGITVFLTMSSSSWLLRPLILFSSSCISVLMWWLLLHNSHGANKNCAAEICLAGFLSCVIYIIDLFVISPFLSDLAKYF